MSIGTDVKLDVYSSNLCGYEVKVNDCGTFRLSYSEKDSKNIEVQHVEINFGDYDEMVAVARAMLKAVEVSRSMSNK